MDWRSSVALSAVAIAVAGAVALGVDAAGVGFLASSDATPPQAEGNPTKSARNATPVRPLASVPFSRLTPDAAIAVELEPGAILSSDAVLVPQRPSSSIVRIAARNNTPDEPIGVGTPPCGSLVILPATAKAGDRGEAADAAPDGEVWVPLCDAGAIARVDLQHRNISATVPLPTVSPKGTLGVATGSVWVLTDTKGVISRIDPATNAAVAEAYVAARPFAVAAKDDVVWVTSEEGNTLTRVDGHTNAIVETITVGPRPGPLAIGEDAVWTLNRGDGSVSRVDMKSNKVVVTIAVDETVAEGAIAVGEGAVWLSTRGVPLVRIDPRTNRVTHRFSGEGGGMVLAGHGSVWVAAGPTLTWRIDPKLIAAIRP